MKYVKEHNDKMMRERTDECDQKCKDANQKYLDNSE